jgi:serine/threonine protein kinase/Flp pilus assembly protein TadD
LIVDNEWGRYEVNLETRSIESILAAAVEIDSTTQRQDFIAQACAGDAELQRRVGALVENHFRAGSFLEVSPFAWFNMSGESIPERPGAVIGPYKLLEQVGEGGFGVVFMAEQTAPVRRKVALKVIKPGMDTRQVIARFEAERQALAVMDHPNISRVLEAGATASGRPYFVMELVRGVAITNYCDENQLSVRERLELFASVCEAIHHAHTKGIIHRDIKPTNVLVTRQDGAGLVKVIDFGVAKAIGQQLTDKTLYTGFAQMVGTPLYMSPEQAELTSVDIDTRSDIYSLGVLLYELLTASTPVDKEQMKKAAYDEIRRIIREEDPPKPSTRLSTAEMGPTIAAHRHTEPAKLIRLMRGELDWIVMKCLEKDRNRRYDTANSLMADIQRYLRNEAVQACPPSAWYRFHKLARRNLGAFITATALALALLLAVITLATSNVLIRQEQARTTLEKHRAQKAQLLAGQRADQIRQEMENLKAANAMLDRGRWYVHVREWDGAHAALTRAIELRPDHASVWAERADLYLLLGLWDLAAPDCARNIELSEPNATTSRWHQHALLQLAVGDRDGYEAACREMRERFRKTTDGRLVETVLRSSVLAPGPSTDLRPLVELSQRIYRHHPASSYSLYILGTAHYRAGEHELAIQRLRDSLAATDWSVRLLSYPVLAMACHRLGRGAEAREALDEAASVLDRWTQHRYEGQHDRGVKDQGAEAIWPVAWWDFLEGQVYYEEAKRLIDGVPPPNDPRLHVLRARAFAALRRPEKAVTEYDAALQLNPRDPQIAIESHRNRGYFFLSDNQWREAASEFAKAYQLRPEDSFLWRFQSIAFLAAGDLDAYREACTTGLERFEKTENPETAGNVLLVCTLRDDALADMSRLLPLIRVADPLWHWGVWARGAAYYRTGRIEASVECFEAAAKMFHPNAWDLCFLAMAHHRLGHAEEARRCAAEAASWIAAANQREFDDPTGTEPAWGNWHERVTFPLLLRESEALLAQELKFRSSEQPK